MITDFGKELRILRIERNENISIMAKKLNISISYLSAIESGLRPIPSDLVEKIVKNYNLNKERRNLLREKEAISSTKIDINLDQVSNEQRKFIFALSRKLKDLSDEDCLLILEKINEWINTLSTN